MAPRREQARYRSMNSGQFSKSTAVRSPFSIPNDCNQHAVRLARIFSSRYVIRRPSNRIAIFSG